MIEKILERLEEEREYSYANFEEYVNETDADLDAEYDDLFHRGLERAKKIVRQVAREYGENSVVKENLTSKKDDGWIPCNERLPEYDWYSTVCWVTLKNKFGLVCTRKMRWCGNGRWIWVNGHDLGSDWEVIAWKPYEAPAPWKGEK